MTWHMLVGWLMLLLSVAVGALTVRYAAYSRKVYATLRDAPAYERYKWLNGDIWRVWIGSCAALGCLFTASIHLGWPPDVPGALFCLVYASLPAVAIARMMVQRRYLRRPQPTAARPRARRPLR